MEKPHYIRFEHKYTNGMDKTFFVEIFSDEKATDKIYVMVTDTIENKTSQLPSIIDKIAIDICKQNNIENEKLYLIQHFGINNQGEEEEYSRVIIDANFVIQEFNKIDDINEINDILDIRNINRDFYDRQERQERIKNSQRKCSDEFLIQVAKDLYMGKIFCDQQVETHDQNLLTMIFTPLVFMGKNLRDQMDVDPPCFLYEYYDKCLPRSINGYPIFMSMQYLNGADTKKMWDLYNKFKAALDRLDESLLS